MPGATRVQLVPPAAWDEDALVAAARGFAATGRPVRPGDAVGDLVVVAVEPQPGATLGDETEIHVLPTPPRPDATQVDVVVLLDVSESMATPWDAKHTRLDAARVALASFLQEPGGSVASVALFEYAKAARLAAGPAAPRELSLGDAPTPKGSSATAVALDAALAHLAGRLTPERAQVVFLFTDGVGEVADLLVAAQRASRLKVPVHSLVFAPEVDEVFDELAKASGGSFQQASYPLTIEFEHAPASG
ncbi:MAG TPA: VWA domain-containing protein [Candidatus Thermoplasmatota archaeon]|nr:VWA domain-containing protein [Candidatus Thermoplasmatota archaeon]